MKFVLVGHPPKNGARLFGITAGNRGTLVTTAGCANLDVHKLN